MLQPIPSFLTSLLLLLCLQAAAQTVPQKLATAFARFEKDPQMQNAIASLYVVDGAGNVVFQKNETIGLAPASTQKIITTATAYALLGKSFVYKTEFGLLTTSNGISLYIKGSGDPTLGSWRWKSTTETSVLARIAAAAAGTSFNNQVVMETGNWHGERIPGGWIWEDIGNYYGAGAGVLNWRENQYDVLLQSGLALGSPVIISRTEPMLYNHALKSRALAAVAGSGDNAYIYFPLSSDSGIVRGTIPVGEAKFVISGALPYPDRQFAATVLQRLHGTTSFPEPLEINYAATSKNVRWIHTETSPALDSILYWFNKKSINLYGEALLKTMGSQKAGAGTSEAGVTVLKGLWKRMGIAETALNVVDGSGLSPLNRLTTQAQVAVLQYAKAQSWFASFYYALPEYNGMKLKSGTINGVKGFAGYHTARNGTSYTLSFLVNNYNGSSSAFVKKMYAVLDVLK